MDARNQEPWVQDALKFAQALGKIEGWLAALLAFLMILVIDGSVLWASSKGIHGTRNERCLSVAASAAIVVFDVPYLVRLAVVVVRHRHPVAFEVARTQWVLPLLLRPIAVIWWLWHFLTGALFACMMGSPGRDGHEPPWFSFFLATSTGFAANGFFIAAVAAATRSERVRLFAWRGRILVDLFVGSLAVVVPWLLADDPPHQAAATSVNTTSCASASVRSVARTTSTPIPAAESMAIMRSRSSPDAWPSNRPTP